MVSAGWKEDDVVGARLPRGQMSDDHAASSMFVVIFEHNHERT